MNLNIILQNTLDNPKIPNIQQFQTWVNSVFQYIDNRVPENVSEVCIRIIDEEESNRLNTNFRKKTGPTNVLSFPNEIDPDLKEESLGDMAICAELVISEANELDIPIADHWAHLTVHGILHLLGFDHINEKDATEMECLEVQILESLNIKNPYQEPFEE